MKSEFSIFVSWMHDELHQIKTKYGAKEWLWQAVLLVDRNQERLNELAAERFEHVSWPIVRAKFVPGQTPVATVPILLTVFTDHDALLETCRPIVRRCTSCFFDPRFRDSKDDCGIFEQLDVTLIEWKDHVEWMDQSAPPNAPLGKKTKEFSISMPEVKKWKREFMEYACSQLIDGQKISPAGVAKTYLRKELGEEPTSDEVRRYTTVWERFKARITPSIMHLYDKKRDAPLTRGAW